VSPKVQQAGPWQKALPGACRREGRRRVDDGATHSRLAGGERFRLSLRR